MILTNIPSPVNKNTNHGARCPPALNPTVVHAPIAIAVDFISASRYTTLGRTQVSFTAIECSRKSLRESHASSYRVEKGTLRRKESVCMFSRFRYSGHYISNYAVLTLLRRQVLIAISLLSEITNDF